MRQCVRFILDGCIAACTTGIVCPFDVNKRFMDSKSAFTVAALSVDRFCAVSSPLGMRKYRRKDCAIYVTIFTWIAATL